MSGRSRRRGGLIAALLVVTLTLGSAGGGAREASSDDPARTAPFAFAGPPVATPAGFLAPVTVAGPGLALAALARGATSWTVREEVTADPGAAVPSLAVDGEGAALVAWAGGSVPGPPGILVRTAPAGGELGAALEFPLGAPGEAVVARDVILVAGPRRAALLAWRSSSGGEPPWSVWATTRDPVSGDWGLAARLSGAGVDALGPDPCLDAAVGADGGAVVVWSAASPGGGVVEATARRDAAGAFAAPETLAPAPAGGCRAVGLGDGRLMAAWRRAGALESVVWSGGEHAPPERVGEAGEPDPSLAADAGGGALLAWLRPAPGGGGGPQELVTSSWPAAAGWSAPRTVATAVAGRPHAVVAAGGRSLLAWRGVTDDGRQVVRTSEAPTIEAPWTPPRDASPPHPPPGPRAGAGPWAALAGDGAGVLAWREDGPAAPAWRWTPVGAAAAAPAAAARPPSCDRPPSILRRRAARPRALALTPADLPGFTTRGAGLVGLTSGPLTPGAAARGLAAPAACAVRRGLAGAWVVGLVQEPRPGVPRLGVRAEVQSYVDAAAARAAEGALAAASAGREEAAVVRVRGLPPGAVARRWTERLLGRDLRVAGARWRRGPAVLMVRVLGLGPPSASALRRAARAQDRAAARGLGPASGRVGGTPGTGSRGAGR